MPYYLPINYSFSQHNNSWIFALTLTIIAYCSYWFSLQIIYKKATADTSDKYQGRTVDCFLKAKLSGLLFLGVIPLFIALHFWPYSLKELGICYRSDTVWFSVLCLLFFAIIVVPLSYFNAQNPQHLKQYPQIRTTEWTYTIVSINILGWTLYLLAYELLFRAILLIPLYRALGYWPALIICTLLYSVAHIPKGKGETLGAIPFGLLIGWLTLLSGTMWLAFFVHLMMALANSYFSFKQHPSMYFTK